MSNKIDFSYNKTLKLTNVLKVLIDTEDFIEFGVLVEKIENYIKSRGAMPIGPLIQKTEFRILEDGSVDVKTYLMRQSNNHIHKVEEPYKMDSVIRVKNCMYVHYNGPEEKMKFAYDKINLKAFEEDIELRDESYTIFVDQQDDNIIADVFVEKINDE